MRVKICGITNINDALVCENFGANALGFIFYRKSKRYINPDHAKEIISELGPFIQKVGVFVNESPDKINQIVAHCGLNLVQLHGDESADDTEMVDVPVIKGFRVRDAFNYEILDNYQNCYLLLDAFSESEYGGTGHNFSWHEIPSELKSKIILAGGVSADNIERIYTDICPMAIDLSSSVEEKPGIKSHKKLNELFIKINRLRDN